MLESSLTQNSSKIAVKHLRLQSLINCSRKALAAVVLTIHWWVVRNVKASNYRAFFNRVASKSLATMQIHLQHLNNKIPAGLEAVFRVVPRETNRNKSSLRTYRVVRIRSISEGRRHSKTMTSAEFPNKTRWMRTWWSMPSLLSARHTIRPLALNARIQVERSIGTRASHSWRPVSSPWQTSERSNSGPSLVKTHNSSWRAANFRPVTTAKAVNRWWEDSVAILVVDRISIITETWSTLPWQSSNSSRRNSSKYSSHRRSQWIWRMPFWRSRNYSRYLR